jgi:hypothetical protein
MRGSPWLGLWARLKLGQCRWAVAAVTGSGGRGMRASGGECGGGGLRRGGDCLGVGAAGGGLKQRGRRLGKGARHGVAMVRRWQPGSAVEGSAAHGRSSSATF